MLQHSNLKVMIHSYNSSRLKWSIIMQRREFIKVSIATSAILVLGGCGNDSNTTGKAIELKVDTPSAKSDLDALYRFNGNSATTSYSRVLFNGSEAVKTSSIASGQSRTLRIFHINDIHNHMVDPSSSKGDTNRLAQMVKIYNDAKTSAASDEVILFVSAGDEHTGNVLDELRGWDAASFKIDPAYAMYKEIGLCAAAIGNHELDKGGELLAKSIEENSDMVMLSANLSGSQHLNNTHVCPAAIGMSKDLRIGFIGLTTDTETKVQTEEDPNRIVADPATALENILTVVAQNCDIVIVLSHIGYGNDRHDIKKDDYKLAQIAAAKTNTPVLFIGGHSHTVLNQDGLDPENIVDGVLIAQTGANGKHLGEIEISLTQTDSGMQVSFDKAKLHSIKKREDREGKHDPAKHETDDDIDMNFKTDVTDPIMAMLTTKLADTLAQIEYADEIGSDATLNDRYMRECAIANFMNDAVIERSPLFPGNEGKKIDFAIFNASGISAGVPNASELSFQDWYGVMPYADTIKLVTMTGAQIKEMVQNNAQRVLLSTDRKSDGSEFNPSGYISWGFLHFSSALRYEISGSSRDDLNATNITIHENSIDSVLDQEFTVSFSSYIGAGFEYWNGDVIGASHPGNVTSYDLTQFTMHDTYLVYRNEIIAYIREQGTIGASTGATKDGRLSVTI